MTQFESFRVRSPPLPGLLWVKLVISSRNSEPVVVTVNVTQRESAIRPSPKNASGLPKPLCFPANFLHSAHDRPGLGGGPGGLSIVPADRSAACEPMVINTMSFEVMSTDIEAPPRSNL